MTSACAREVATFSRLRLYKNSSPRGASSVLDCIRQISGSASQLCTSPNQLRELTGYNPRHRVHADVVLGGLDLMNGAARVLEASSNLGNVDRGALPARVITLGGAGPSRSRAEH